ncbi:L-aspartate oxidase [Pseudomarimonas arenosa]|uniref:L-aspartate oxidase n=1 Tax=Pseudomarimonas arenosa TaxID=2774145 RepID=A0AAW3ZPJ2_9GAMM|nr:FAD-binding protein [Pseudomarimonas arenosa]MBD8526206.1 FAD-dependent oxidoreductase [Pseudomarimonas arenosa]
MSAPPLVIIGAGMAGLCTALAAAPRRILLISRGPGPLDCASALAQGGIAAALAAPDSPQQHAADTLAAGAGVNHVDAVRLLTEGAAAAIGWLCQQGLQFDLGPDGPHLAHEGGHRYARVLHAGGDASGLRLIEALSAAAQRADHIEWISDCECLGWRSGAHGISAVRLRAGGAEFEQACDDLVLASGSLVGSFAHSTHPPDSEGALLALALHSGAQARDLHYLQFHPTSLAHRLPDGRMALVTEALRGRGACLRDADGRRLMAGLHPMGDLAPRDIVARRVARTVETGGSVWLHAEHLSIDWPLEFPAVWLLCQSAGVNPAQQPIPVQPAAHYHMGGLATDLSGRSSLPGLYAVGEVACTGVHGANRLASNSLLEAVVFGTRLGRRLATESTSMRPPQQAVTPSAWHLLEPALAPALDQRLRGLSEAALGPLRRPERLLQATQEVRSLSAQHRHWRLDLLAALLQSALNDPISRGAHYWDIDSDDLRRAAAQG